MTSQSATELSETNGTIDIMMDDAKVGWTYDGIPDTIHTDEECRKCLSDIRSTLPLTSDEYKLVDQCISVVSAENGDDVVFGPIEILALGDLAKKYPERSSDIIACSHHISESIEWEGMIPDGAFLGAARAHAALGDALEMALKGVPDDSDEEFEEPISDDD
jgi:hypothetical protein